MPSKLSKGDYGIGGSTIDISNTDLLTYWNSGFYRGYSVINAPTAGGWHFQVMTEWLGGTTTVYIAWPMNTQNTSTKIYFGSLFAGNWSGWRSLPTQEEMDSCFTSVSNGKSAIASAITDKGVSTSSSDTFAQMAANIRNIPNRTNYIEAIRSGDSWVFQLSSIPNNFVAFDLGVSNITNSARVLTVFSYGNYHYIGTVTRTSVNYAGFNTATSSITDNPCQVRSDGTIVISNMAAQIMIYW